MTTIFERPGFAVYPNGVGGLRLSVGAGDFVELTSADAAELGRRIQEWLWSEPARRHLEDHARLSAAETAARTVA
jgi:hypothetical protein